MSSQTLSNLPSSEETFSSSSSSSSSSSTRTSSTPTSSTSSSSFSSFGTITRPSAILNISDALVRSAKRRQVARQTIVVSEKTVSPEENLRLSPITYAAMCLEGKVPQPSVSMQQPTEELDVPKHSSYYKWDPSASPFPVQHMSLSQFRETNLSAEERQVARPGEIRRAMFGEMADMRGLWTDIIFNNFQREPVEVSDPFAEENKKLAEENTAKPTKTIVYDGPLNTKSAFDVSDDEGEEDEEDEEEESVEEVAKVAERLVGMVAQIEKVVEIKMVDVKRGDVKEIDIKKVDTGANIQIKPMPMTKFGKKRTAQTALPRQAKRKSQWTELQGRLQEASNKMKQLMRCNGGDFLEQSNEPSVPKVPVVPSAHTVCRPPPLKVVGRTPPRRPNWAHQNIFDEAGLEQFLDCSCAASVEKCPGCKPSAVRVAVEEDLI